MASRSDFNDFFNGYVECALWSSNDNADESGGEPLDANYSKDDIEKKSLARMKKDCVAFMRENRALLKKFLDEGRDWGQAGHDFWLTRNGHGAGFWARGSSVGDALSKKCKPYGSCDLYVGDDGKVYVS